MMSAAMSLGRGALPYMMLIGGFQAIGSAFATAMENASEESKANDGLYRTLRDGSTDFDRLLLSVRKTTDGLGLTYQEAQRLSLAWANLTNETRADNIQDQVRFGAGFARGYGLDPAAIVQGMGRAAFLGEDPKRFAAMIADAAQSGGMTGQVQETMQAVLRWSEHMSRSAVTGTGAEWFASMYAGLNATGLPGLKGAGAEELINRINAAVTQGGAFGEASKYVTMNAFARHGVTDPYKLQFLLEGGAFGKPRDVGVADDTLNFEIMREQVNRMFGTAEENAADPYRRWHAMSLQMGINMRQAAALDQFHYGETGKVERVLDRAGLSLTTVNADAINDIASVSHADEIGLDEWRRKLMGRSDVAQTDAAKLVGLSGDALREEMVRLLAQYGMEKTEGQKTIEASAALTNALTSVGEQLLPLRNNLRQLADGITSLVGAWNAQVSTPSSAQLVPPSGPGSVLPFTPIPAPPAVGPTAIPPTPPRLPGAFDPNAGPLPASGSLAPEQTAAVDYLLALERVESANGAKMVAPGSSARGWHQFTSGTWLNTVKRYAGDRVAGMTEEEILALRFNKEFSRDMASLHINKDIVPALNGAGVDVTPLSLYAGWHFGTGGGPKVMQAGDTELMANVLSEDAIAANPYLKGMNVGQWKRLFGTKFGFPYRPGGSAGAPVTAPMLPQPDGGQTPIPRMEGPPAGTPVPAGAAPPAAGTQNYSFRIDPLRVVREGPDGTVESVEHLPITQVGAPRPWGLA